eukprot:CAMPEP_0195290100 /NCGR_PEP_ID=MMETSP0707-20130614/6102_1 /TAXON_ID=33640 /ORGANISM="Asterionellopsis glacialis, Strain CCMP134" /LENGTH=157 /DNA_ID=CAMNT_0040350177 /DNA_START=90 /DNA_END=563 /DNA_ORIENTATION=-
MSLVSTVRILSRRGTRMMDKNHVRWQRSFSAVPISSSFLESNSNNRSSNHPDTVQFFHNNEKHDSTTLEETVEHVWKMPKIYENEDEDRMTNNKDAFVVLEQSVQSAAMMYTQTFSSSDRLCQICGRDEIGDLCDICADGMTVSQFIPDHPSSTRKP